MCTIGSRRVINLIADLRRAAPGVRMTVREDGPGRLLERLMAGEIDCALVGLPTAMPDRCEARTLYQESYVVAFPPSHRFESMNAVRFADVDGEPYL
ncbi:MAG: LysR family transcriptional regulator substrate-binding protein [Alphaproteobacteria bacterium]|nr:LysR family transcriptional regulator substrate-binding protein [Alphaproteobacteria bacterium]